MVLGPQRSNAARVRNIAKFVAGKLLVNSKTVSKSQKVKPLLKKEALHVEYLWKSFCLFTSDVVASYFVLSLYFLQCFPTNFAP